jgi:YVTN family beta-propeller protein
MRPFLKLSLLSLMVACAVPGGYHVVKEIKIGGEGGWDYLTMDPAARRLYVSHATKVVVVDVDSGKIVGEIPDTPGVHGIAIADTLNRGFVSNGRGNSVTIFDLKTLKLISQVKTGQNPDAIQYEAGSGKVFTFNGRSKDSTVIDAKTGNVESTIPLGGKPEFSAADGKGKIYANIEDTHEIVEIDAKKMSVSKRYTLTGCEEPSGLAMDVTKRLIFSVCGNQVMAISNPDTGKVIASPAIGDGADGAAYDPGRGLAFSSNGQDGNMTVVGEVSGKWQVVETVQTKKSARTITIDPKTHLLYLPAATYGPPPEAAAGQKKGRPPMVPDSFELLVVGN